MRKRDIYTMAEAQLALMNAFNKINADFFNGELEKVIITLKEGAKKMLTVCGLIVRATKECNISCMDCNEQMKIES